jgi:MFS family permease
MAMSWRESSYEVLPALSVRGKNLRYSLRLITLAWMYGVVWMSCTTGEQVRLFVRMLGFNDFAFGLMAAIPFLATFGQLNMAILIERTGRVKMPFLTLAGIHRLLWLAVAAVPLLMGPSVQAVAVVLGILAISSFLAAMSSPPWMTWMGDLIPRRIRGRYFARRAQLSQIIQVITVITLSLLLDKVMDPRLPQTIQAQPMLLWAVCGILAAGAIFGTLDIWIFRRVREVLPPSRPGRRPAVFEVTVQRPTRPWRFPAYWVRAAAQAVDQLLLGPMRDPVFRNYVSYGATITFTMTASGWYFWRLASETLRFSALGTNALFMVIGPLAGTLTAGMWGRMQDRWGRRPVLIVATIGATVSALPWLLANPHTPNPEWFINGFNRLAGWAGGLAGRPDWQLLGQDMPVGSYLLAVMGCIVGGASWTGIGLAQTGVVLGFADGSGRSVYVAASSVLISMGGVLGGLVGGILTQSLEFLQDLPLRLGPVIWNNWHITIILSLIVRAASLAWLMGMPDPGARSVRDLLRLATVNTYNVAASRFFWPLRVFGWTRWGRARIGDDADSDAPKRLDD